MVHLGICSTRPTPSYASPINIGNTSNGVEGWGGKDALLMHTYTQMKILLNLKILLKLYCTGKKIPKRKAKFNEYLDVKNNLPNESKKINN